MRSPVPRYTYLAFQFTRLLDLGVSMPVEELRARIGDGTLLSHLEAEYRPEPYFLDLSLYDDAERHEVLRWFSDLADGVDEDRKFGVSRNGIAVCLAYCVEAVQQGTESS